MRQLWRVFLGVFLPSILAAQQTPTTEFRISDAGRDFIGCLWFETLLKHDGRSTPAWLTDEILSLLRKNDQPTAWMGTEERFR